jgi:hypothetical protein
MNLNNHVYDMYECHQTDIDDIIDFIYDVIDTLNTDGLFTEVDEILRTLDVTRIPIDLQLAYLSITIPARDKLKERADLYKRCVENFGQKDSREAQKLFCGLE